ncbi:MAG: efflux RND transporter periplasmic adaptor subunit [Archangium sp.]|nr:efflux RND transporter periplasmic adaptor subunit [Archangium sp.]
MRTRRPPSSLSVVLWVGVVTWNAMACLDEEPVARAPVASATPVRVETSALRRPLLERHWPGTVTVDATTSARVDAPVAGAVAQVLVRSGDRVKAGQKLFSIRGPGAPTLQARAAAARAQLAHAGIELRRAESLFERRATTVQTIERARARCRQLELELAAADAAVRAIGALDESGLAWARSSVDGTVIELSARVGQQVDPRRDRPLARVADLRAVTVAVEVPQQLAAAFPRAMATATSRCGTVRLGPPQVSEWVDAKKGTVTLRYLAQNEARCLRINAFVDVMPELEGDVTVVRTDALSFDGSQHFLTLEGGEVVPVVAGVSLDGLSEVQLEPGTRYRVDPAEHVGPRLSRR